MEILIALIALSAALGGTALGSLLTKKNEHRQWLRNEKIMAYRNFLTALNPISTSTFHTLLNGDEDEQIAYDQARNEAWMQLMMVASEKVARQATELYNLTKRMKADLEIIPSEVVNSLSESLQQGNLAHDVDRIQATAKEMGYAAAQDHLAKVMLKHQRLTDAMRDDLLIAEVFSGGSGTPVHAD